jgi:MFS family permease
MTSIVVEPNGRRERVRRRIVEAVAGRWRAAGSALGEHDLRCLNLAFLGSQLANWAYAVAIAVYAFAHGGAAQVGLMTVIRLAPAAIAAPFSGALADRFPRRHVMIGVDLLRACAQTAAAILVIAGVAPIAVYLVISVSSLANVAFEPAKAALLPSLARTPEQLTAANALGATIESTGLTIGPALGGLLLASTSVQVVLFFFAGASLVSAALVWRIRGESVPEAGDGPETGALKRSLAGFTTILGDRTLRFVVGIFAVQMLAFGLLNVFLVTIALSELHSGATGTGWLNTAAGVGGIAGGILTISLAGRHLARPLAVGMGLLGGGYLLVAAVSGEPVALVGMLLMNLGGCYVDVATFTLLQRAVDGAILARAFSVIATIIVGALLIGGALAPLLVSALGIRGALGVSGGVVLAVIAAGFPRLRAIDASASRPLAGLALLERIPLLQTLPTPALERLAAMLQEHEASDGQTIVVQGESGDTYCILVEGQADVTVDGRHVTTLGPGEGFGEIALLLDTPRTATVRAQGAVRYVTLDRETFLATVTGHEETNRSGQALAQGLLTRARPASFALR